MGLSLTLLAMLTSSLSATCKAARHRFTTIPLRSLADQGGAFDTPKEKCPPDGGSLPSCVRDSPASSPNNNFNMEKAYPSPLPSPSSFPSSLASYTPTSASKPIDIPNNPDSYPLQLVTPPPTPDQGAAKELFRRPSDFLASLFPHNALTVLSHARGVQIKYTPTDTIWNGAVLDINGQKTLYVDGKGVENVSLRESVVALLDLADEHLECSAFVIALDKSSPALGELVHSLMYVGASVVTKPPFKADPNYVLVGMDI